MNEFLLVFRTDYDKMNSLQKRSPEEMRANAKAWMEWVSGIAAQNKLVDQGKRLLPAGKVVKADNVITDGPYTEIKECIVGYTIVKAASLDDAIELVNGCPWLTLGGSVEVREIGLLYPSF
jgi:hypothetical protein